MKIIPLSKAHSAATGWTHKVTITYADLVTAGGATTTATITLFPNPESGAQTFSIDTVVDRVHTRLITAFDASDAAINSLTLSVGDGGSTTRFINATQLAVDGTEITSLASSTAYAYLAADTLDALFTVAGGGTPLMNELTSGEVHVYFRVIKLEDFDNIIVS